MIDLKNLLEKRIDRIALMVEATARKIIKKELKNFKKDMLKGVLKNAAENKRRGNGRA